MVKVREAHQHLETLKKFKAYKARNARKKPGARKTSEKMKVHKSHKK